MGALSDKYVLVVEDDAPVRRLEMEILRGADADIEGVGDGAAAIDAIEQRRPDLVVLDLVMPGIDGWGVLEKISALPDPPPVLVVSGRNEIVPPGRLGEYVAGYVRKPFVVTQFVDACTRAINTPSVIPATGGRKEARRSFMVEATLLSPSGSPVLRADLRQISGSGFQVELAIPVRPGDPVRIAFQIPGRQHPLELSGQVRWRDETTFGAEIDEVNAQDREVLRDLISG
jgi:CheY-like chemotaxis protein